MSTEVRNPVRRSGSSAVPREAKFARNDFQGGSSHVLNRLENREGYDAQSIEYSSKHNIVLYCLYVSYPATKTSVWMHRMHRSQGRTVEHRGRTF